MQLNSSVAPPYLPDADQDSVLRLGLQPLNFAQWMPSDRDLSLFVAHKELMKQQRSSQVYQALPGSEAAQLELYELLLAHLLHDQHQSYRQENDRLHHVVSGRYWPLGNSSLWQSSLWVQEDICLLEKIGVDYCLTAASVCSPSNWKLEHKIGKSLDHIHGPVPDYQTSLSARVNRLFDSLSPEKPLLRYNWSLQDSNELFWREDTDKSGQSGASHWRVERQTLRRLPNSRAIVFGIRIYIHPLAVMETYPGFKTALAGIVERLPTNQKNYKGINQHASS